MAEHENIMILIDGITGQKSLRFHEELKVLNTGK